MYLSRAHRMTQLTATGVLALAVACSPSHTSTGGSGSPGSGEVSGPTLGPGGNGPTISDVEDAITQKFKEVYGGNCGAGRQYPTQVTVTFTTAPVIAPPVQAPVGNTQVTQTVWPAQTIVDVHLYSPYPPNIAQLEGSRGCCQERSEVPMLQPRPMGRR